MSLTDGSSRNAQNGFMRITAWLWPTIIMLSALSASLFAFTGVESPVRQAIAFWFLMVCPGMAFVRLLRIQDQFAQWSLAIALSLALDASVAGSMLYAGVWSPTWAVVMLTGVSVSGAVLQLALEHRDIVATNSSRAGAP